MYQAWRLFPCDSLPTPKGVLITAPLEAADAALVFERAFHGRKPQLAELIDRRLYGHAWPPFSLSARRVNPWLPVVQGGILFFTLSCPF